jgi:hypothetical protein
LLPEAASRTRDMAIKLQLTPVQRLSIPDDGLFTWPLDASPRTYHHTFNKAANDTSDLPGTRLIRLGGINRNWHATAIANLVFDLTGVRSLGLVRFGATGIAVVRVPDTAEAFSRIERLEGRVWLGPNAATVAITEAAKIKLQDAVAMTAGRRAKFPRHTMTVSAFRQRQ